MDGQLGSDWWAAIQAGEWERLPGLLARGARARWREPDGDTALHYVCRAPFADERERLTWARLLVKHKADVNAHSDQIVPVIAVAVYAAADHTVRLLHERGARLNVARQAGVPLLFVISEALVAAGQDADRTARLLRIARYLIRSGCDVNARTAQYRQTALINAVSHDQPGLATLLLRAPRVDLNLQDHLGLSALHYAAHMGRTWAAHPLLSAGARPNLADRFGFTPLHEAAGNGHVAIVDALLAAGADRRRRLPRAFGEHPRGATARDLAQAAGHTAVVERL
jgi:ankyrin repeat protein